MGKKIRAIILCLLCVLMILTSCKRQNDMNKIVDNNDINTMKDMDIAKNYNLVALKVDKQGLELSSAFQLSSNKELDNDFIKSNLQIIPETDYEIEKISNTSYNIIPASNLENNKVYQVKLNSPEGPFSWAFQTKKQFELEKTIPINGSSYVPEKSGIEMYFSMNELDLIDEYFSIYPNVEGEFVYNGDAVIFVPKNSLEKGKRYTVTIKKGYGVKDSEEKLLDDYSFAFTVERSSEFPYYGDDLINIHVDNTKIFKGYFSNKHKEKEYKIDIYKFNNSDSFATLYKDFYQTKDLKYDLESSSLLKKVNTIYQKPYLVESSYYNEGLFELPKELAKGHYLLNISLKDTDEFNCYQFLQVNDMMLYNAIFDDEILLYAIDGKTSEGIGKAEIYINDVKLGETGKDGVLVKDIDDIPKYADKFRIIKLKAKNYDDFIYIEDLFLKYEKSVYNQRYNYFSYAYTDRDVYLPTDTVNLWGYARNKDDTKIEELKLELKEPHTGIILDTKNVKLNDIGTYKTNFSLNNYTYDYFIIDIYHNDFCVDSKYIDVKEYVKPLYYIESEFDKTFVYSGEPIKLKLNAKFFDGYPVKDLNIRYEVNHPMLVHSFENVTKLSDKGESIVDIDTTVVSNEWRPTNITVYSLNDSAEETTIRNYNSFTVFPKRQMLEIERDNSGKEYFSVLLHEIDNSLFDTDKFKGYEDLRGKALDANVKVEIIENYYEKIVSREYYDFINKQKVVEYSYNKIENKVFNETVSINSGRSKSIQIPNYNSDRYYEINVSYDDGNGGIIEKSYFGTFISYYYDRNYYTLDKINSDKRYRLDEEVDLSLKYNDNIVENVDNDKILILVMNNGLLNYKLYDESTFKDKFIKEYIPNVILYGVYINNGFIYQIQNTSLNYDYSEKQMYFDVTTDKEEYKPGEEVVLNIKAYDENKNPLSADLNISVVDEAYFHIFPQNVDIISRIYDYNYNTGLRRSYLSNVEISLRIDAEKGGGGDGLYGDIREDFKDTNVFESLRTDKNGMAQLKFKLADNITSWRITYQGISEEKHAGNGKKNISSTLPLYVDMIMHDKYLTDDNISVSLRTFGKEAANGENVDYKLLIKNKDTGKEEEFSLNSTIGEYTNISIGKKDKGIYEIYAYASSGKLKDAIKEEFEVVESYVYFNNLTKHNVTESTVLDKVHSNAVITIYNSSRSDFFNSLRNISSIGGGRIDQSLCSIIATKYINSYFDLNLEYSEDEMISELNNYGTYEGAYSLLPYSDGDAEITAKLVYALDDNIIDANAKKYFKNEIANKEFRKNISAALWGAAKYREPILLDIYEILENQDISLRDKLYLNLALAELGDYQLAEENYKKILENKSRQQGEYLYIEGDMDPNLGDRIVQTDNYELTGLMSILGVKIGEFESSDKMFKYIYKNPSYYTLSNFEQLIYIINRDILQTDEIKDLFGEVRVAIGNDVRNYKLKLFDRVEFSVKKDDISNVKFSNIKGEIICDVRALGNKDDLQKNRTQDFGLDISYENKDSSSSNSYKQSDIVKVTIMPSVKEYIEYGYYEITYVMPSGFRFVKQDISDYNWNTRLKEKGQKLTCNVVYDRYHNVLFTPIVFYMQAAQSGEYAVDYAVMKDCFSSDLNYIEKINIVIE